MPNQEQRDPRVNAALERRNNAKEKNVQAQTEAQDKIQKLQSSLQSLRQAQQENDQLSLEENQVSSNIYLSSMITSRNGGGMDALVGAMDVINSGFQQLLAYKKETKDPNADVFLRSFEKLSARYKAHLVNNQFPSDDRRAQEVALAMVGMERVIDVARQTLGKTKVPHITADETGALHIVKNPGPGDHLGRVSDLLPLSKNQEHLKRVAQSDSSFIQWTSEQSGKANSLFPRYKEMQSAIERNPEDQNIDSIYQFCRTRGVDSYSKNIEQRNGTSLFKRDSQSMSEVESALSWLEIGIAEFDAYRHGAISSQSAKVQVAQSSNTFDIGQSTTTKKVQPEARKQPERSTPKNEKAPPATTAKSSGTSKEPSTEPTKQTKAAEPKKETAPATTVPKETTAPKQKEVVASTGEINLPSNQTVYLRAKNAQVYHFLQPNYTGRWSLGNFADAVRSPDGSRWIVKPRPGTGSLETSLDGKTWTDAGTAEKNPSQTAQKTAPTPRQEATKAAPAKEKNETVVNTEIMQTGATTLEFPANDIVNVSYKTEKAWSPKPYAIRTKVSAVDFYLYSLKKENGVWKFAMKPGKSGEITVQLATGSEKTFRLGENAQFDPKKKTEAKQAPSPTPATDAPKDTTPRMEEKKTAPQAKKLAGAPADDTGKSPTKSPQTPKAGPTTPSLSGRSPEPIRTPERKNSELKRSEKLAGRYTATFESYNATIQKDYAEYGGSKEWKLFDQKFAQLGYDIEDHFKGHTARFIQPSSWKEFLVQDEEKESVEQTLVTMNELLEEYKAAKIPKIAPTRIQTIDTLHGDNETLLKSITKHRATITKKGGAIAKDFAVLDKLYSDTYTLTKKPETQKAILVCHETLAKNYAEAKEKPSTSLFGSAFNFVSSATSFKPGMTESDFRAALLANAETTPMEMKLTPKQLLELVRMKQKVDVLKTKKDLTEKQRYEELIDIIGDNFGVLEALSKDTAAKLKVLETFGYKAEVGMKDVFNTGTIDWLIAAQVSAKPVTGISDHSFFYLKPVEKTQMAKTEKKNTAPKVSKAAAVEVKTAPVASKVEEPDPTGRLLSAEEIRVLGFTGLRKGEHVKEIDGDSYIACTKTTCRPIKPAFPIEKKASVKTEKEVKKTPVTSEEKNPVAETKKAAPEQKNTISAIGREFRIAANESFTVTYNPPVNGSSSVSLTPQSYNFKGTIMTAEKYADVWVIKVLPQYEGTVTLTRASDKQSASLTVKADKEALAAMQKAKEKEQEKIVQEVFSEEEFNQLVLNSPIPVVVDMYKVGCQPCNLMAPDLDALALEDGGNVRIVKFNGENLPNLRNLYAPMQDNQHLYPTLIVFEKGKKIRGVIGRHSRKQIRELLPKRDTEGITMNQ